MQYCFTKTNAMQKQGHRMPLRVVIYAKDIQLITGKKERSARRLLEAVRRHYGKRRNALVTVREFCMYTGLAEEDVRGVLVG
ncbi:hypothetical protein [Phnomibacter ginsenosidimutans]|nr:hypothetical protein [Phnomibacter ginsenosidimutans]